MKIKREPPLNFRPTNYDMRHWLLSQPNRSRVINDALKVYMGNAPWRDGDTEGLSELIWELNQVGVNINQIARAVNASELTGVQARALENLIECGRDLRVVGSKINALLRLWNS